MLVLPYIIFGLLFRKNIVYNTSQLKLLLILHSQLKIRGRHHNHNEYNAYDFLLVFLLTPYFYVISSPLMVTVNWSAVSAKARMVSPVVSSTWNPIQWTKSFAGTTHW